MGSTVYVVTRGGGIAVVLSDQEAAESLVSQLNLSEEGMWRWTKCRLDDVATVMKLVTSYG